VSVERGAARISLAESAADVAALREGGAPGPRSLIHVAHAAEHALRRMLRDDPTAPVELRLRALAPEELSLDALLAELRRHDRIPMQLAAGMHELAAAAARVEGGAPVEPRDAANAVSVADALEQQLQQRPEVATLEDPLLGESEAPLEEPDAGVRAVPVPADDGAGRLRWIVTLLGVLAVVVLVVWVAALRGGGSGLRRADLMVDRGRTATAAGLLQDLVNRRPEDPRAAIRLARIFREAGRPVDALLALRTGIAASPDDPRLNEELGVHLLEQRQPREAVRAFGTAIRADSASERAWVGLVRALRESGELTSAHRAMGHAPEAARLLIGTLPIAPAPTSYDSTALPPLRP
jgi:tetratricopeptide (TPR) repeat protein